MPNFWPGLVFAVKVKAWLPALLPVTSPANSACGTYPHLRFLTPVGWRAAAAAVNEPRNPHTNSCSTSPSQNVPSV